ncbi:protein transport protein Sec24C isoform X2 [Esox lucius]|uniref:protein transport protein Sec24C isoform X2 n=1 Tax=Esox lucius TaxID=8010 RepID=UPI001476C885|nr:protein transport protein Sec24C isoform X2 [Esox lucius]
MDVPTTAQTYGHSTQPQAGHNGWSATHPLTGPGCTVSQGPPSHNLLSLQDLNLGPSSGQSSSNTTTQIIQGYQCSLPKPPLFHLRPHHTSSSGMLCSNQGPYTPTPHLTPYSNQGPYNAPPCSNTGHHIPAVTPYSNQGPYNAQPCSNTGHHIPAVTPYSNQGPYNAQPCSNTGPYIPQPAVTSHLNQAPCNSSPPTLLPLKLGPPPSRPPPIPGSNQGHHNMLSPSYPSESHGVLNGPPATLTSPNQGALNNSCPSSDPSTHPTTYWGPNQASPLPLPGMVYGSVHPSARLTLPVQEQPQWALPQQRYSHSGALDKPGQEVFPFGQDGTSVQPSCPSPGDSGVSGSPSSESRYGLDPQLLPSAVRVMAEDRAEWGGKVFVSGPDCSLPPLATTDCVMEDRGNSSPRFLLATSYCFPCEGQMALQNHVPLGALVTPLATMHKGERPLPVCNEADTLKGCGLCGAYMCFAMGWQDCGQRFYCPFCGNLSEVRWQHYHPTKGVQGDRLDKDKRPELSLGSYELLDHEQDASAAVLLLAVDVSAGALRAGQVHHISQQLRSQLTSLHREEGAVQSDVRLGLITYNSRIHLYDLSPALSRPHMLVVTETEELQLPVREGLLVPLKDCIDSIDSILQHIPLFSEDYEESSGVPFDLPVRAGLAILQAFGCRGKLLVFHSSPFTEGAEALSPGFFNSKKLKSLFQPPEPAISLVTECVSQGCGVHLFVFSQQSVGGAWPGHVPYLTGGALHCYHSLQGELDRERFSCDLRRTVERDTAYRATLRIHVSKDLRVSGCYGSFVPGPNPAHVAMATLNEQTTLAFELTHSRALDEKKGVIIQTVLSYTSQQGVRRTRVQSLTLRCSRHLLDTFRNCQAQTLLTFYCKKMYCAVLERPLQDLREELQTEVTAALACYRKHCSSSSVSPGQLVLPQYLRALPVYLNSLRKSEVLLPGLRSSIHQRLQLRCQLVSMDVRNTAGHFYPFLLPLPVGGDTPSLPDLGEAVRCRAASLDPGGLYLVHGPLVLLLWVGQNIPSPSLVQLFNIACLSALPSGEIKLPVLDNTLSVNVRGLIDSLNSETPYTRKLQVVKQGDSCEEALQRLLVEDKSPNGGASYADFLYHLHVNSIRLLGH